MEEALSLLIRDMIPSFLKSRGVVGSSFNQLLKVSICVSEPVVKSRHKLFIALEKSLVYDLLIKDSSIRSWLLLNDRPSISFNRRLNFL